MSDITYFAKVGQETLYLCGNEWVIKTVVPLFLNLIGLQINISNPFAAYILTFCLIGLNYKVVIPFEKLVVQTFLQKIKE